MHPRKSYWIEVQTNCMLMSILKTNDYYTIKLVDTTFKGKDNKTLTYA